MKFITGNKDKMKEFRAILGDDVEMLSIDLVEIQNIDAHNIIRAKLAEAVRLGYNNCLVEDTSLYLDGLKGLPGPLIKWFMKTIGNEGILQLARSSGNFSAQAKTIIGYSAQDGSVDFYEGVIAGSITEPRGEGFGWDPIFIPIGHDKTFGEMSAEEKNSVSMRKLALEKLKQHLYAR